MLPVVAAILFRFAFAPRYLKGTAELAVANCAKMVHLPSFVSFTYTAHPTEC